MVLIRINVACEFLRKIFTKLKGHCFWVKIFCYLCVCVFGSSSIQLNLYKIEPATFFSPRKFYLTHIIFKKSFYKRPAYNCSF